VPVIPAILESTNRKTAVQTGPCLKQEPISKIINRKRAGRVAQVVEYLPSNHEDLSPTPSIEGRKEGRKERKEEGKKSTLSQEEENILNYRTRLVT
jgi:hypothetical protein